MTSGDEFAAGISGKAGEPGVVVVLEGEAGVDKSTLWALAEAARARAT